MTNPGQHGNRQPRAMAEFGLHLNHRCPHDFAVSLGDGCDRYAGGVLARLAGDDGKGDAVTDDEKSTGATRTRSSSHTPPAHRVSENRLNTVDEATSTAIARALGDELRRTREARGLSRAQFVTRLPSGIGDRTLLAYEHGLRQLTVLRLIELSEGLEVDASIILGQALQRARINLENLVLRVNLHELLNDNNNTFRPIFPWARNRLNDVRDNGIVELTPPAVKELAAFLGRTHLELAKYLARFTPEPVGAD